MALQRRRVRETHRGAARRELAEEIKPEASFIDDLGADSLDIVELVMAMEEAFDIEIPDDDAEKMQTIGDAMSYVKERTRQRELFREDAAATTSWSLPGMGCVSATWVSVVDVDLARRHRGAATNGVGRIDALRRR